MEDDPDVERGCERWGFNWGIDEMAIPAEMGLYLDFEVTGDGIPYGCPGLEFFKTENWFQKGKRLTWSVFPKPGNKWPNPKYQGGFIKSDPQCGLNQFMGEGETLPVSQHFEKYAKNQDLWVSDFFDAYEKMLANGYNGDLVDSGYTYDKIVCPRQAAGPKMFQDCHFA